MDKTEETDVVDQIYSNDEFDDVSSEGPVSDTVRHGSVPRKQFPCGRSSEMRLSPYVGVDNGMIPCGTPTSAKQSGLATPAVVGENPGMDSGLRTSETRVGRVSTSPDIDKSMVGQTPDRSSAGRTAGRDHHRLTDYDGTEGGMPVVIIEDGPIVETRGLQPEVSSKSSSLLSEWSMRLLKNIQIDVKKTS